MSSEKNKVQYYREQVIGCNRVELARHAQISDKTLKSVEKDDKGSLATKTKIYNAINKLMLEIGKSEIARSEVFPTAELPEE